MIKQPNLVINDLFYILEGAGPYLYKDSKIKKTELMIIGDDAIAVDLITLNMLNLEINRENRVKIYLLIHLISGFLLNTIQLDIPQVKIQKKKKWV